MEKEEFNCKLQGFMSELETKMDKTIQETRTDLLSVIGKKSNLTELYKITDSHINQIREVQERSKIARDEVNDLVMRFRSIDFVD